MNRAPAFSPVLQLAPLAAALIIAVAIYAALIGAWRKTARWLRGWWESYHPVHKKSRHWHEDTERDASEEFHEQNERIASPEFAAAFGAPWEPAAEPVHVSQSMTLSGPLPTLPEPDEHDISDEAFEAAKADVMARFGVIPPSLQRVVDQGGRFGPAVDPEPEPLDDDAIDALYAEPESELCRCGRPAGHLEDACLTGEPGDIDREFSTGTFEAVKVDG
jgi:hypothetical protein